MLDHGLLATISPKTEKKRKLVVCLFTYGFPCVGICLVGR